MHGDDVEPHLRALSRRIEISDPPSGAEARVVHENPGVARLEDSGDGGAPPSRLEIGDDRLSRDPVGLEAARELFEAIGATRHDGHVMAALREAACELRTDTARRAGDQDRDGRGHCRRHHVLRIEDGS